MASHLPRLLSLPNCLLLLLVVATSLGQISNYDLIPASLVNDVFQQAALQRQMDAPSLVEMLMFGLAGIPVYKAVGMLLPFLINRKSQAKHVGRVYQKRRNKRDLAYANQLLDLLFSVEKALEKYGVTEPQCQLRSTCEIHKKSANAIGPNNHEKNFIKMVE